MANNFPTPGATGVYGQIIWAKYVLATTKWVGEVEAWASLYGTPPSTDLGGFSDPLRFTFSSATMLCAGDHVTFDVVQGKFAPFAQNVVLE